MGDAVEGPCVIPPGCVPLEFLKQGFRRSPAAAGNLLRIRLEGTRAHPSIRVITISIGGQY